MKSELLAPLDSAGSQLDEDRQELSIKAARCSSPEFLQKMPIKVEDSLIGRVVREGQYVPVPSKMSE